ncbi:MAG: secretion system X translation initiation factor [Burkholderiales bacterium]
MSRVTKSVQMLMLGCAGVGAFYAAAHWSSAAHAGSDDGDDLVRPAIGAAPGPAATASAGNAAAPAAASSGSATPSRVPAPARADRTAVIPGATGELFAVLSWLPPPPPPPPAVPAPPPPPPAPPVAPPLPFAFVGMVEQGTPKPQAFLAKGDGLLIVAAGDTIDGGVYRVESLSPTAIVLKHVPTNTQQSIQVSGGSK